MKFFAGIEMVAALFMVIIFIAVVFGVYGNYQREQDFKEACSDVGGASVHNGRNWECVK